MIETIVTVISTSGLSIIILHFLLKPWINSRIKSSIEHEYKKQFELFSRDLDKKEKVELVAEIMAEYLRTPKDETMNREQRNKLNTLSFKASLWLPGEIAIELSKRLQNLDDAKSPFEIILMARESLINDKSITLEHITYWSVEKEKQSEPSIHMYK